MAEAGVSGDDGLRVQVVAVLFGHHVLSSVIGQLVGRQVGRVLARVVNAQVLCLLFKVVKHVLLRRLDVQVAPVEVDFLLLLGQGLLELLQLLAHALVGAPHCPLVAVVVLIDKDAGPEVVSRLAGLDDSLVGL